MNDEEIDNLIHQMIFGIPKNDNKSIISTYGNINMDNLTATIRRLKKVPDIDDLMKENEILTNNWNELEEWVKDNFRDCEIYIENDRKNIVKGNVYIKVLNKMKEIKEGNNE